MKKLFISTKNITISASLLLLFALFSGPVSASAGAQASPGNSNLGYLLAGSLLTWGGFFAYTFFLSRKNASLQREIAELQKKLESSK